MLYSSNGGGMSGQKNDAAGSVGFFRQSLCDLFFFALVVDIEMGEEALHLWQGRVYVQWPVILFYCCLLFFFNSASISSILGNELLNSLGSKLTPSNSEIPIG